ncbi:unnamed protein product [Prorocentrum cordatum]|uniref:AAA+ ATPase domain-containing protein n=1 Tax=Prorocentrum cordatum TaxID=2364126 RepID=A0ABN9TPB6_9DINO|nr:unnamed protein product [Polarella glacialis]
MAGVGEEAAEAAPGGGGGEQWAVTTVAGAADEFERRVNASLPQHSQSLQAVLRRLLAVRSGASGCSAGCSPQAAAGLAREVAALAGQAGSSDCIERRLHVAMQLHGIGSSEEWWEGRAWRSLRAPLLECGLSYALQLQDMLSEERCEALRRVVAAKSSERIDRRFAGHGCKPWHDPHEEWRLQLDDWKGLLAPYPWSRARPQVMSRALAAADLREPLTQHERLVRSYELLRCLGGALLDGGAGLPQAERLRVHGLQFGCWRQGEVSEETIATHLCSAARARAASDEREPEPPEEAVAQLGFRPAALREGQPPRRVLARLAERLLAQVEPELRAFCEQRGLRGVLQGFEVLAEAVQDTLEHAMGDGELLEPAERVRDFLLAVSEDYLRRARASGAVKSVDFALLAEGDPRVELLLRLEQQAEARRLLDDMALGELQELLCRIQEAFQAVHGPGCLPPSLELWASRLQRPGDPLVALHPSEVGELSAALQVQVYGPRHGTSCLFPNCVCREALQQLLYRGGLQLAQAGVKCVQTFRACSDRSYADTAMDRDPAGGAVLFGEPEGVGRPTSSRHAVLTFYGEDVPLYFVALDGERLKITYSASEGLCLGYLIHKNVFADLLEDAGRCGDAGGRPEAVRTLRAQLLAWAADVLRSPLPPEATAWILRCCERMGMMAVAPHQDARCVNLAVIAHCLCRCCPSGTEAALFLRSVLANAWHVPVEVRGYIERKSDMYGLYIVCPGTAQIMQDLGLHVAVLDFECRVWQRSVDNTGAHGGGYLGIIAQFSNYCCFAYVKGLRKIDDILLKWLAEYTRLHPWRFVFLEGVDTSFNFPENRDRCNFHFAPPNPLHTIKTVEDLHSPAVEEIRPTHTVPYPERLQPSPEDIQDPRRLFQFFQRHFAPEVSDGDPGLFSHTPAKSSFSPDFRDELERHVFGADPCLVLLVSAPGAGKTHHMGAIRGRLEGEMQFDIHEFDGSSDILVTTALAEVLQRTVAAQGRRGQRLLILDEYHMLSDDHKDELFEWVRAKLGPTLRVVLIGNRIDSKDRERLEQSRPTPGAPPVQVALIQTRLSRSRIESVLEARGNSEKHRGAVCDWLVGCRLVFGEESASLRLCDALDQALQRPGPPLLTSPLGSPPTSCCIACRPSRSPPRPSSSPPTCGTPAGKARAPPTRRPGSWTCASGRRCWTGPRTSWRASWSSWSAPRAPRRRRRRCASWRGASTRWARAAAGTSTSRAPGRGAASAWTR